MILLKYFLRLSTKKTLRKQSIQEDKLRKKPWITPGTLTSIKNKNKLYRKYIRVKDPNRKNILHNEFKKHRNQIDKILKSSKALHYQRFFENNKLNLYKTWAGIKEIINVSAKQKQNINGIANKNNIINNPKDIAEHLNKHFCNIAKKIETGIPPSKQTVQNYLKNPITTSLSIKFVTKEKNTTRSEITQKQQSNRTSKYSNKIIQNFY